MSADLGFLLSGCSPFERRARLRELRALALVYLGPVHPATTALAAAIADPAMTERALGLVGDLPALRKRRLLATYGAIMGGARNCANNTLLFEADGRPQRNA